MAFSAILHLVFVTKDIVYIVGMLATESNVSPLTRAVVKGLRERGVKEVRYFRYQDDVRKEIVRIL